MAVETNKKIIEVLSGALMPTEGDVGIEIEAEASDGSNYFPTKGLPPIWSATSDGSLRGIAIEYVMKKPCKIDEVGKHLNDLQSAVEANNTHIKYSFRAGTHVHVNCQDLTPQQVVIFAALYYTVENLLVDWCGDDRVGNLFCLRVRDAEAVIPMVGNAFKQRKYGRLADNNLRYASLNFCALVKYGSLEFRAMATEPNFDRIAKWAEVLYHLKIKSKEFDSIQTILEHFSMTDPQSWSKELLGDFYKEVKDQDAFDQKVWEGIRYAQDLMFYTL